MRAWRRTEREAGYYLQGLDIKNLKRLVPDEVDRRLELDFEKEID